MQNYFRKQTVKDNNIKQANIVQWIIDPAITATKVYTWIFKNPVQTILDSGAAVSIITNNLRD